MPVGTGAGGRGWQNAALRRLCPRDRPPLTTGSLPLQCGRFQDGGWIQVQIHNGAFRNALGGSKDLAHPSLSLSLGLNLVFRSAWAAASNACIADPGATEHLIDMRTLSNIYTSFEHLITHPSTLRYSMPAGHVSGVSLGHTFPQYGRSDIRHALSFRAAVLMTNTNVTNLRGQQSEIYNKF
eukprot:364364-Chlamydomonas_euryale.AAC.1